MHNPRFESFVFEVSGHEVNFWGYLPRRASEIQLSLALIQLSPDLEKLHFLSRTWWWHVKAYFLKQAWMPGHMAAKVNPKYMQRTCSVGKEIYSLIYNLRNMQLSLHICSKMYLSNNYVDIYLSFDNECNAPLSMFIWKGCNFK